jgi:hypothetical protein
MSAITPPDFDKDGPTGVKEWCERVKAQAKTEGIEITAHDLVIMARKDVAAESVPAVVKAVKELYADEYAQDKPKANKPKASKPAKAAPKAKTTPAKATTTASKSTKTKATTKAVPVVKNGKSTAVAKGPKKATAKGEAKEVKLKNKTGLDVRLLKLPSGVTQATVEGISLRPFIRGIAANGMKNDAIWKFMNKAGLTADGVNPVGKKMSFASVINDHAASGRRHASTGGKEYWHGEPAVITAKLLKQIKTLVK